MKTALHWTLTALSGLAAFAALKMLVMAYEDYKGQKYAHLSKRSVLVAPPLPDTLDFAGEPVPLDLFDVREALDHELTFNRENYAVTLLILKRAHRYRKVMTDILREQGVPTDFFYLMIAESAARSAATSPAGAKGFWQFLPETAREFGLQVDAYVDERKDPIKSTYAACKYLKRAYAKFKNWHIVAGSYNMGMAGITEVIRFQGINDYYHLHFNPETARYLFRILSFKLLLENPEKYGYKIYPGDLYEPIPTQATTVNKAIPNLVAFAREHGTTYKMIRLLNPWILKSSLPAPPPGKGYVIQIPVNYAGKVTPVQPDPDAKESANDVIDTE
ncbi:MAG: lytic transglycosylase domain-containing protein [Bacteroidia bacterium]|nr:lytic transglycosylase domain-containing protein [Bacteroidia bacterium]MDW8333140.1 lytic transglycosylase domain-containing protein [Bacteroidia bacterium]